MNRLSRECRSQVLRALVEGNAIRATRRITGTAKGAVLTFLEDAGAACLDYQDNALQTAQCSERRYSPAECIGTATRRIAGNPDEASSSTSHAERQNLAPRMQMRRFTRLANAFSKEVEHLEHAIAFHFMHYNFARPHKTLATRNLALPTPAMAAGVADHVWAIEEIVGLAEAREWRGSY